jgi:hypothetical protein
MEELKKNGGPRPKTRAVKLGRKISRNLRALRPGCATRPPAGTAALGGHSPLAALLAFPASKRGKLWHATVSRGWKPRRRTA